MDPITQQVVLATAGAAAAGDATYVDDVFSTFLYEGTNSAKTITNDIDLSGEGGLVWIKSRGQARSSHLYDTERGARKRLISDSSAAEQDTTTTYGLQSFTSSGFTLAENWGGENESGVDHVSWTFRKAPGFFDVVTWTGNGATSRTIAHSLGSAPGMILVKRLNDSDDWQVYHRSIGATKCLQLNQNYSASTASNRWNDTEPTSTVFTVANTSTNANGKTYVAYLFAHDDQSFGTNSDEAIIKCGSYTGTGTASNPEIDLGFEPQWLMIKNSSSGSNWIIVDTMRGFRGFHVGGDAESLAANLSDSEPTNGGRVYMYSQGFTFNSETNGSYNASGDIYIYMAIRRPHKPPEAATDVFDVQASSNDSGGTSTSSSVTADFTISAFRDLGSVDKWAVTRLLDNAEILRPNATNVGDSYSQWSLDQQFGFKHTNFMGANNIIEYTFRRAPGFFDVVNYEGTGQNRTVNHNLGATPELIIVKGYNYGDSWQVYNKVSGATKFNTLRQYGDQTGSSRWNDTEPTSTVFTVGTDNGVNNSGYDYIAYLFASLDGISKVGSYTGTGSAIDVDCGFTAGARFVLIKRIDGGINTSADWHVWDSTRGIVSGNDPYILLNNQNTEVTNTDYIDPLNAGFTVTSSAPAALNTSGGTYLFFAIA